MDPFDSWDVVVQADPSVLDPLSSSVAGNMLGSVTQVANCVNGLAGSGCSISDNAGGPTLLLQVSALPSVAVVFSSR
jgi:hypothetical protein